MKNYKNFIALVALCALASLQIQGMGEGESSGDEWEIIDNPSEPLHSNPWREEQLEDGLAKSKLSVQVKQAAEDIKEGAKNLFNKFFQPKTIKLEWDSNEEKDAPILVQLPPDLNTLTPEDIAILTKPEIESISNAQLLDLDIKNFQSLNASYLTIKQLEFLVENRPQIIDFLTEQQISQLSREQIKICLKAKNYLHPLRDAQLKLAFINYRPKK